MLSTANVRIFQQGNGHHVPIRRNSKFLDPNRCGLYLFNETPSFVFEPFKSNPAPFVWYLTFTHNVFPDIKVLVQRQNFAWDWIQMCGTMSAMRGFYIDPNLTPKQAAGMYGFNQCVDCGKPMVETFCRLRGRCGSCTRNCWGDGLRPSRDTLWSIHFGDSVYGKCYCCGSSITRRTCQMGHVVPSMMYGPNTYENLRPVCRTCNTMMGTVNLEAFKAEVQGIYSILVNREDVFYYAARVWDEAQLRCRRPTGN